MSRNLTSRFSRLASLALALGFSTPGLEAQGFELELRLQTGTQVPGAAPGVVFTRFVSSNPALEDGVLCFNGQFDDTAASGSRFGVFTVDQAGNVAPIVFETDLTPNGQPMISTDNEMIDGGRVSWVGWGSRALYLRAADGTGITTAMVDVRTANPARPGENFRSFNVHGRDGDDVVFRAEDQARVEGLYHLDLATGEITLLADPSTPSPFSSTPGVTLDRVFGSPTVRDGRWVCSASDTEGNVGLIADFGSGLVGPVVVGQNVPGRPDTFYSVSQPDIAGDKLVFESLTTPTPGQGVYIYDDSDGSISSIADFTVNDEAGVPFFAAGDPSISIVGGVTSVVFQSGFFSRIHMWIDGSIHRVISRNQVVGTGAVTELSQHAQHAIDGMTTAMQVAFADGVNQGLVVAVPPPQASFETTGVGCDLDFPITLSADSAPRIGQTTTISVTNIPSTASAAQLLFGTSSGTGTPLDALGAPTCILLVDTILATADLSLMTSPATLPLPVPAQPSLIGVRLDTQALVVAPGSNPLNVLLSDLGRMTIGG